MSNRCPSCEKFVSLEPQEPELELDIVGDTVVGNVRLVLVCADCGDEGKEANLDIELPIEHECDREEDDFEIVGEMAEPTDRYETRDRYGKPIKSARYQKRFYGADINVTVKCTHCDEEIELFGVVEEQASGFDELW